MATLHRVEAGGEVIECAIRFGSARRTRLLIRVNPGGLVEVVLPPGAPASAAVEAVHRRGAWILNHLKRLREAPALPAPAYCSGATHWYLGQLCRLDVLASRSWEGVRFDGGRLVVSSRGAEPDRVRRLLLAWLRDRALEVFATRLDTLAPGIPWLQRVPSWSVKTMRRRWGSCSAAGHITLNTRLVQTSPRCIDYVLLHELAHLRELNHGPRFYAVLTALLPDWKEARSLLRRQEHVLV